MPGLPVAFEIDKFAMCSENYDEYQIAISPRTELTVKLKYILEAALHLKVQYFIDIDDMDNYI